MGRNPKPIEERTSNLITFRHNETPEFYQALKNTYILMRREKKNLGTIFSEALIEYSHRHYELAFQTNLQSYSKDSPLNQGQIEQEIINKLTEHYKLHGVVLTRDIGHQIRVSGYESDQVESIINRLVPQLIEKGVKVSR